MDYKTIVLVITSVFAIFSAIMVITRIFGLRTFAKMSSFDFASTIAIGSILASIILNTDQSIFKGIIALLSIVGFQAVFSLLIRKSRIFQKLVVNQPQLLVKNGVVDYEKLKKCNVDKGDLMAKLREANVHKMQEVQAVIFESTGDISVLHSSENIEVDSIILEGVAKA